MQLFTNNSRFVKKIIIKKPNIVLLLELPLFCLIYCKFTLAAIKYN